MVALFACCHGLGWSVGSALHRIGRHHVVYLSFPITWTHTVGQTASLSPIRVILEAAASLGRCKKTSWPAWTAHRSSSLYHELRRNQEVPSGPSKPRTPGGGPTENSLRHKKCTKRARSTVAATMLLVLQFFILPGVGLGP